MAVGAHAAAPPPPGTAIVNTAAGAYQPGGTGTNTPLSSNAVTATVQALNAFKLSGQSNVNLAPGASFTLGHPLANVGNVAATYVLTLSASGGFVPANLQMVEDLNGSGVVSPGDPVLASGGTLNLAPGASMNLLVTGAVPANAAGGATAQIRIAALDQGNGANAAQTDSVTVSGGPSISVVKTASSTAPVPGATLAYSLTAVNGGSGTAFPVPVTVDGAAASLFVLRDPIPANTTFAAITAVTPGTQLLYHRDGDPTDSYWSTPPASGPPDAVAWALPSLAAGASLGGKLGVTVNANATGNLANTALAEFTLQGAPSSVPSNTVQLTLPALAPAIGFYTSPSFSAPLFESTRGALLYLQFSAAQCNTNPSVVLAHPITLTSKLTGNTDTFTATETGPNTGIFRVLPGIPTSDASVSPQASGSGVLGLLRDDTVTATLAGCSAAPAVATLLIDPSSVVFDSKTNAPVSGAGVQLLAVVGSGIGASNGSPATVYGPDGVTPAPSSVTTASDGSYSFPMVPPGTYRLQVTPPAGYVFPSKVPLNQLPAGHDISATGSYGGVFSITGGSQPVRVDVPVDHGSATGASLFVQKTANKLEAQIGDLVDYTVSVSNNAAGALAAVRLYDALPNGFAYVRGSARWNGAPLPDPTGGAGPILNFTLGAVAPGAANNLVYRVRIDPGVIVGNNVNSAQASSGSQRSNVATANVLVHGGVVSDKAFLIGKVFADCNGNRIQDEGEPGLPGIRIYLDNGTYAITDEEGKYSLYGLTARTYTAKLDTTTLPEGAALEILDNRNAGDPGSQFADLQYGELHKTNFAVSNCTPALLQAIAERRKKMLQGKQNSEIARVAAAQVSLTPATTSDSRTLPASGLFGQGASAATAKPAAATTTDTTASSNSTTGSATTVSPTSSAPGSPAIASSPAAAGEEATAGPVPTLAGRLASLTPQTGFIDLVDGQLLDGQQVRVRVKGPWGTELRLGVNEHDIGDARVGEKSCQESLKICAWDYVGVPLDAGRNVLRVAAVDPFGIVRGSALIHVTAPGKLAKIEIVGPAEAKADVPDLVSFTVRLRDQYGTPIIAPTTVTLDTTLGQWQATDLDPKEPGVQVLIEGGEGFFNLAAPEHPGKAKLHAYVGEVRGEADLTFVPYLRPLIAAGIAEGIVRLGSISAHSVLPVQSGDAFETQIQGAEAAMDNGRDAVAGHASLFLKGKISGQDLLTMSYDSDKPTDTNLFRDIQPDQFYPVYGDSSVKGFDAQSTGKLYVRIDRGTSYVMYGDFTTQNDNPARLLTQYNRALNGARTHVENGDLVVDAFTAYTSTTQVIDEIPANGTSGPYTLSARNGVINSAMVEIITRDRNQPSLVINDVVLTQFTDYAIEALVGQILFKAPVPSLDANLNPNYIRVTYEINTGGPSYWIGGVDAREKIAEGVVAGATEIRDANPLDRDSLRGVNLICTRFDHTTITAELAQTHTDLAGTGDARRVEVKHDEPNLTVRAYAVQTDPEFSNPNSTFNAGQAEYGTKAAYALDDKDRLLVDALRSTTSGETVQDTSSLPLSQLPTTIAGGGMREGASVGVERTIAKDVKITASVRHFDANDTPTQYLATGAVPASYDSVRVRLDAPVPEVPRASAFAQYDTAIDGSGRDATTIGANYQIAPQTKLYFTHETSDSLSGDYSLSPTQQNFMTVFGIDTTYMKDGQLFNEYRVGDAIDGRSAENAVGLRNLWQLAPGLGLSTTVQKIHPVSGLVTNDATALTGALEYTAPKDWKASTRLEWSDSLTATTWLGSAAVAVKITPSLTALARGLYNEQIATTPGTGSVLLGLAQFGLAYRPPDTDVWNALARVERKRNDNETLGSGLDVNESADIFSAHLNVQPNANWVIDGRYGVKKAVDYLTGFPTAYMAQIVGMRSVWDINSKWDAGLQYYVELGANDGTSRQQAYGVEVGYLLVKNSWLSVGYNIRGIDDPDLAGQDYIQRAFYLRLRVKFDEAIFRPRNNAQELPADTEAP